MDEYNKYKNSQNHKKHNKRNELSFYVSLAICITAVGLAVWSTFSSYSSFKEKRNQVATATATATQANNQVTGVTVEETTTTTMSTTESTTLPTTVTTTTVPNTSTTMSAVQTMLQVPGNLIYPVKDAKVSKPYSENAVYNKTMGDYRSHLGIDFNCKKDANVLSMSDGVVSDIYDDERMGKVVILDCGTFMIYYSGLDNVKVQVNDSLSKGDTISNVGEMPCEFEDGNHLHVAIRVNGSYVDPLSVIGANE